MRFSTRNAFYLRASNYRVIPLFLYLDERHVDWMTDRVLQLVIGELQTKMRELLSVARYEKKHKVFVERGEGYQYCYFLRSTTRTEVVLLKQKTYSLRAPTPPKAASPPPSPRRKTPTPARNSRTRSRSRSIASRPPGRGGSPELMSVDDEAEQEDVKPVIPPSPGRSGAEGEEEEEEEEDRAEVGIKDWKPDVNVTYKGFGTSSLQLVLIIEPYPPLAPSEYAPPSSRLSTRSASIASSYSRARSKQTAGMRGTASNTGAGPGARYSSTSLSVALDGPSSSSRNAGGRAAATPNMRNMRNATRSVSATPVPNSRRGGSSVTPFASGSGGARDPSATPFGEDERERRRRQSQTPLFIPGATPFGDEDDDEEEHEAYTAALREGRLRLPSVSRPAGQHSSEEGRRGVRRGYSALGDEDEDDADDIPEGMMEIGQRLVRSSEIEEGVMRVQGGWEERAEGEESAVMGREGPDE